MNEILLNIKDRILYVSDIKEVNKQTFFRKVGLNYSNFTGKSKESDLGSKYIGKIILNYPDINVEWLITGNGPMFKEKENREDGIELPDSVNKKNPQTVLALLEDKITLLEENKIWQQKEIARLEKKLAYITQQLKECQRKR